MKALCDKCGFLFKLFELKLKIADILNPFVHLAIRIFVGYEFWKSGVFKLPAGFLGFGKGNWENTLWLYEYEHPLPGLSPEIAAYLGTTFEIVCPLLLFIGLGGRFAAAILFVMALVIDITYQHNVQHVYWMITMAIIMLQGSGRFSVDYLIRRKCVKNECYQKVVK